MQTQRAPIGRILNRAALVLGLGLAIHTALPAQSSPTQTPSHATRAEIERWAEDAERDALSAKEDVRDRKRFEAAALRERLRDGDFQVGDRIILHVPSDSALTDTFVVRAGRAIQLPGLEEISLNGVLRSELEGYLTKQISRYLRDPRVEATSLIRLAVLGEVVRPGFFAMSSDVLVSDAIMVAGGPSAEADVNRISVRRGAVELLRSDAVRQAMVSGRTLDQLHLRAGDEIVVAERRRRTFSGTLQIFTGVAAVLVGVLAVSR